MDDESVPTRVYLDSGDFVRASATVWEVASDVRNAEKFVSVVDPGDAREKLICVDRIVWIEEEGDVS